MNAGPKTGVSIHAPARGATKRQHHNQQVSIHAPARGALQSIIQFQSTRPHGARRAPFRHTRHNESGVSIHAPARGATATITSAAKSSARTVSIHAPARGATISAFACCNLAKFQSTRPHGARPSNITAGADHFEFQSTRPHGARRLGISFHCRINAVSIHAPARGATYDLI